MIQRQRKDKREVVRGTDYTAAELRFVETIDEVRENLRRFEQAVRIRAPQAKELARSISYWVYDVAAQGFAPSLLVAYRDLTLERYEQCREIRHTGMAKRFDGTRAREAIARLIGEFAQSDDLTHRLTRWLSDLTGEKAQSGINTGKWKFTTIQHAEPDQLSRVVGCGFGDAEENSLVERAAITHVTEWYLSQGWRVESVEATKCGYDLLCRKGGNECHVEVKGTRGGEQKFIITAGEVQQAESDMKFKLFVVVNALRSPLIHQYSGDEFSSRFKLRPIQFHAEINDV